MRWMRLRPSAQASSSDGGPVIGIQATGGGELSWIDWPGGASMVEVIRMGAKDRLELVKKAQPWGTTIKPADLESTLLAPLDPPVGDVIAAGRNYAEHAEEMVRATGKGTDRPTVFAKAQTTINGPFADIVVDPRVSLEVDWEVELGVVIGVECRDVTQAVALEFVFGYTILNDITARDIQYGWGGQFYKGKSIDGYCPIGPWIVSAVEIADPQNLELELRVNGETKQRGHTHDMIFPVAELISQLSMGQTLRPGTLIATGTPPGVGYARDPREFLRPGDVMETEIHGIGTMRNRIVGRTP